MECSRMGFLTTCMQCLIMCAMGWMQMLTKFHAVVMFIVIVAKEQPFMQKTDGITLSMEHCLVGCLMKLKILKR